ncbi:uncharacterized protein [Dysidea avara]|uniref:uncharacterized protein isoform X2 n=1 Tax=Dysidea avara TaxID=196820 RepID=UPI00332EE5FF
MMAARDKRGDVETHLKRNSGLNQYKTTSRNCVNSKEHQSSQLDNVAPSVTSIRLSPSRENYPQGSVDKTSDGSGALNPPSQAPYPLSSHLDEDSADDFYSSTRSETRHDELCKEVGDDDDDDDLCCNFAVSTLREELATNQPPSEGWNRESPQGCIFPNDLTAAEPSDNATESSGVLSAIAIENEDTSHHLMTYNLPQNNLYSLDGLLPADELENTTASVSSLPSGDFVEDSGIRISMVSPVRESSCDDDTVCSPATEASQQDLCRICASNPRECVILPCGHASICRTCGDKIGQCCPFCRKPITAVQRIYF